MKDSEYKFSDAVLLVDLDCVLDTRLSTILYLTDLNKVGECLSHGYTTRPLDLYKGIDINLYKETYANRGTNKAILLEGLKTPIVNLINDYVIEISVKCYHSNDLLKPSIIINTYPYILTEDENKVLLDVFITLTGLKADIELIHKSNEELTPMYIKDKIALFIKYDFKDWLETHAANGNFKKVICPEVVMYGPAIFYDRLPNETEIKAYQDANTNFFKNLEDIVKPLINLKLLDIENFSIDLGTEFK